MRMELSSAFRQTINFPCLPVGAQLFHSYTDLEDLYPVVIAYLRAGIERGDMAIWIIRGSLNPEQMRAVLSQRLDEYSTWEQQGKATVIAFPDPAPADQTHQSLNEILSRAHSLGFRGVSLAVSFTEPNSSGLDQLIACLVKTGTVLPAPPVVLFTFPVQPGSGLAFLPPPGENVYLVQFSTGCWSAQKPSNSIVEEENTALRLAAERALVESQQRYFSLFTFASDAILLMRGPKIIEANRRCEDIFGISQEEIVGRSPFDFSPTIQPDGIESREKCLRLIRLALEGSAQVFPWQHLRKNGTPVDTEINLGRVMVNGEALILAVLRDMTAIRRAEQIDRERSDQAEALRLAASELNSTLDPNEVLLRVLRTVRRIIPNDETKLILVDADQYTLVNLFPTANGQERLVFSFLTQLYPNFNTMEQTRSPLLVSDTRNAPNWLYDPVNDWIASFVSAPLVLNGQVIGFICLDSLTPGYFQPVHAGLLQIFANQAAMALENARLFSEAHQRASEHEALARVSARLRTVSKHTELISVVLEEISSLLSCEGAALLLIDPLTGDNVCELGIGFLDRYSRSRTPPGEGLTWKVIENGLPYSTNHLENEPALSTVLPITPCAACCLPLFIGIQPALQDPASSRHAASGAIWVIRKNPFHETELHLLNALVDILAAALNRTDLLQRTQQNARNLETVNHLGRDLSETHDLPTIYQRLGEAVSELVEDISTVMVSLFDPLSKKITCVYALVDGALVDVATLPPLTLAPNSQGTQSRVVTTKQPLIVDHLAERMRNKVKIGDGTETQSALFVPMLTKDQVMGIIQVQSYRLYRFGADDVELLSLIANTASVAIENARLISATQTQVAHLEALHAIDEAINSSLDLQLILAVLLNQVRAQLGVDAAGVLLYQSGSQTLEYTAGEGFRTFGYKRSRVRLGAEMAGVVIRDRKRVIVNNRNPRFFLNTGILAPEGFHFYAGLPLIAKGEAKGVLEVFHRTEIVPNLQWVGFLEAFANQAAIAVGNSSLFEELKRSHFELAEAYDSTLTGWMRTLELRDDETEQHTGRVISITIELAREMGMVESEIEHVRRGALLHDIGKMGIPDSVLHKKGPFTVDELEIMRTHPLLAYQLLSPIAYLAPALDIPYCHHEKWDGSGYPRGLKGEQIPLSARIFAIADVWDALCSDRVYRLAWPRDQVVTYIKEQSGKHFDPQIVELFLRTIVGDMCT